MYHKNIWNWNDSRVLLGAEVAVSRCLVDPLRMSRWLQYLHDTDDNHHHHNQVDDAGDGDGDGNNYNKVNVGREAVMECKVNNLRSYKVRPDQKYRIKCWWLFSYASSSTLYSRE